MLTKSPLRRQPAFLPPPPEGNPRHSYVTVWQRGAAAGAGGGAASGKRPQRHRRGARQGGRTRPGPPPCALRVGAGQ
eukprot:3741551-Pyramimonas_sp.AAC.1